MDPRDQTQLDSLGNRYLYPLSHLTGLAAASVPVECRNNLGGNWNRKSPDLALLICYQSSPMKTGVGEDKMPAST